MAKIAVAPLVGAWIEIMHGCRESTRKEVAPLVGAWIEIKDSDGAISTAVLVAPLVGAWIEIRSRTCHLSTGGSRSPRGSVD